ncbi:MAG: extracellular solute-binding protein [Candidatus Spechtbacterales bacterium]
MALSDKISQIQGVPAYRRNRIIAAVAASIFGFLLLFGFVMNWWSGRPIPGEERTRADLVIWDFLDNREVYREIIANYERNNSGIRVEYVNKRTERTGEKPEETYHNTLINAFANDEGPDIYLINNNWLPIEQRRLLPANEVFSAEEFNPAVFLSKFPDVVRHDFAREERGGDELVYAVPMFIDTLALYYNVDNFNTENLVSPPQTFESFVDYTRRLRRTDDNGNIIISGAALGAADTHDVITGGDNVNNAVDILSFFMLQAGARMNDEFGLATFNRVIEEGNEVYRPGADGFDFYTSFARPDSENYAWNPEGSFSLDAFANGTAAMMFNYSYQQDIVRDKNPGLNFKVAPMPQLQDRINRANHVNYADYWGWAVSRRSENQRIAWEFLMYLSEEETVDLYAQNSKRPPSLKSLVDKYRDDEDLGVFVGQILTARSWLMPNPFETERILDTAIKEILDGRGIESAASDAQNRINGLRSIDF